jgi:hypothetical protein
MSDPASLQNLHDIVVPPPVAWWPPAPGWYAVVAVGLAALALLAYHSWKRWRRNRYRGEALRELGRLRETKRQADLRQLPVLLKRAALSAWPRNDVAALVGEDWHRFLDESGQMDCFTSGVGDTLDCLAYASGSASLPTPDQATAALDAAEQWLKQHRVPVERS